MAHLLALNEIVEVQAVMRSNVHYMQNVLHYTVGLVGGASLTDQVAAGQLGTFLGPQYNAFQSAQYDYELTQLQVIAPVAFPIWVSPIGAGPGHRRQTRFLGRRR